MIQNTESKIYFAARDTVGTRSLYYTIQNSQYYYSNDIGGIFSQINLKKEPDMDALRMLVNYGSVPYDATLYRHVKRLPAGHYMTVDKDGKAEIVRYWKPEEIKVDESITEECAKEKFLELFDQAIKNRIDDISTTSFELSGGLDSSSVVSMIKQKYPKEKLHTVSMTFGTLPHCNESEYIDSMNDEYDLSINKISIDNVDYKNRYTLEYNYKLDPYWPILITHTMFFPMAIKLKEMGIKKVLTGQGGDDILAGNLYCVYDYFKHFQWFRVYRELKAVKKPVLMLKRYIVSPLLNKHQKRFIKSLFQLLYLKKVEENKQKTVSKKSFKELSEGFSKVSLAFWNDVDTLVCSHQTLTLDISPYHVIEKHYGISFSHPFFDRKLMEFMLSLPPELKYSEGVTKILLRKAMEGILPEKIRKRRDKAEFTAVLRQQIDAIDLHELLSKTYLAKLGLMEQEEIDTLKDDYQSGKMKTVVYFWKIINMEYWYRYNFVNQKETA